MCPKLGTRTWEPTRDHFGSVCGFKLRFSASLEVFCHPSGQTHCCGMFLKWHYEQQKLKQQHRINLSSRFALRVRPHLQLCTFCKEEIYTPSSPLPPIGSGPTCMLGGGAAQHGNVWVCDQNQLHAVTAASRAKIKTNPVDKSKSQLNKNHTRGGAPKNKLKVPI